MRTVSIILSFAVVVWVAVETSAQMTDAGRGPLPLVVPTDYDEAKPAPLVVLLHGYTSSGKGQEAYMKFGKLADAYGYLFIAPDGTKEDSDRKSRFWNATEACCNLHGSDVDDSSYLKGLIEEVKKHYSVDSDRVYLIGHSNGGFMSHRMAVDHPDTIAAIASLAGAAPNELSGPKPERPVNILQIHGTDDSTIRYEGGEIDTITYPGAVETVEKWAAYNGGSVESKSLRKKLDLERRINGKETTITRYENGSVELWTIHDGKHVPALSKTFSETVIKWLMAHPKASGK
jgi:polyhydroxybutyrate depolymerase